MSTTLKIESLVAIAPEVRYSFVYIIFVKGVCKRCVVSEFALAYIKLRRVNCTHHCYNRKQMMNYMA